MCSVIHCEMILCPASNHYSCISSDKMAFVVFWVLLITCVVQVDSTKYTKASTRQNVHIVPVPHFVPYEVHLGDRGSSVMQITRDTGNIDKYFNLICNPSVSVNGINSITYISSTSWGLYIVTCMLCGS